MPRGRVLLVDDNEDTRRMLKLLLEVNGYEVIQAKDGREATQIAKEEHPDLILMDLMMPGVDGFDATQQIRQMEEMSQIPIIALTAHFNEFDIKQRAVRAGANECLQKPNDIQRLKFIVNKYLIATT